MGLRKLNLVIVDLLSYLGSRIKYTLQIFLTSACSEIKQVSYENSRGMHKLTQTLKNITKKEKEKKKTYNFYYVDNDNYDNPPNKKRRECVENLKSFSNFPKYRAKPGRRMTFCARFSTIQISSSTSSVSLLKKKQDTPYSTCPTETCREWMTNSIKLSFSHLSHLL